jgi:hypothetical protein
MTPLASARPHRPGLRVRVACSCCALAASATLLASLLGLFAGASSTPWLPESQEAIALARACDARPTRQARDQCMHEAVLAWQAPERQHLRVAEAR